MYVTVQEYLAAMALVRDYNNNADPSRAFASEPNTPKTVGINWLRGPSDTADNAEVPKCSGTMALQELVEAIDFLRIPVMNLTVQEFLLQWRW